MGDQIVTEHEPTVEARSDAARLAKVATIPSTVHDLRWAEVVAGPSGTSFLGPTDTHLFAFMVPNDDNAWTALGGPSTGLEPVMKILVPRAVANAVLPPASVPPGNEDPIEINAPTLDPRHLQHGPFYRIDAVLLIGEGVLLCASTS